MLFLGFESHSPEGSFIKVIVVVPLSEYLLNVFVAQHLQDTSTADRFQNVIFKPSRLLQ